MQHATHRVCSVAVRSSAWSSSGLPADCAVCCAVVRSVFSETVLGPLISVCLRRKITPTFCNPGTRAAKRSTYKQNWPQQNSTVVVTDFWIYLHLGVIKRWRSGTDINKINLKANTYHRILTATTRICRSGRAVGQKGGAKYLLVGVASAVHANTWTVQ